MEQPPECHGVERAFMPAVCRRRSWIYFDRGNNNVLIIKNRHPDARKASARSHQRASRAEGPCVSFRWFTVFMKPLLSPARGPLIRCPPERLRGSAAVGPPFTPAFGVNGQD